MCLRISKKQLSRLFGFYSPATGRHYSQRLRDQVFTDVVLHELDITPEQYRKTRTFSAHDTKKIYEYFNITRDDLKKDLF